jgi:hypothetical protein
MRRKDEDGMRIKITDEIYTEKNTLGQEISAMSIFQRFLSRQRHSFSLFKEFFFIC